MEARKITVVQTKNQRKSVIMSAATTLSELKADLRANNIDYDDMTFFEGTSKVELKTDDSVLPHDVPWKGTITNELVFMLTNTNKKIKSGAMSRAEAYDAIKRNNLQGACMAKFGKNFTMCKTADLISLVEANSSKPASPAPTKEEAATPTAPMDNGECVDKVARAAISKLAEILESNGAIDDFEKDDVLEILGGSVPVDTPSPDSEYKPKCASPYADDEIDDMFSGMGI